MAIPAEVLRGTLARGIRRIQSFRALWSARRQGVHIHSSSVIGPLSTFQRGIRDGQRGSITIGPGCQLQYAAVLFAYGGTIVLGRNVFCGPFSVIYGHGGVEIGDDTLVSMHCRILSSEHRIPAPGTRIRSQPDLLKPTRVGRDAWLGAGVTVLGGVSVGEGCVVGAGSVVTKDLPPRTIAYGVPARVVGYRKADA
jgi:acetyltransferase-like isoleucine patch superfamily enzyme